MTMLPSLIKIITTTNKSRMNIKPLFIIIIFLANQVSAQIQLNEISFGEYDKQMFGYLTDIDDQGDRIAVTQLKYPNTQNVNLGILIYENKAGSWVQLGEEIVIEHIEKWFGHAISLSGDGNSIAIGLSYVDAKQTNDGKVIVYKFINDTWVKKGNEIIGKHANGNFGFSLDLSFDGKVLCVGSPAIMDGKYHFGNVTVYNFMNDDWSQKGNVLKGESKMRGFGYDVCISNNGQFLSLNAPGNESLYARKVKVFQFKIDHWNEIGEVSNDKAGLKYGVNHALAKDSYSLVVNKEFEVYGSMDFYKLDEKKLRKTDQELSGIDGCLDLGRIFDIDNNGEIMVLDCTPAKIKVYKNADKKLSQIGNEISLDKTNAITSISVSGNGKRFVIGSHLSKNESKKYGEVRVYDILD